MINYPDGRKAEIVRKDTSTDHRLKANRTEADAARDKYLKANMGMEFEAEVSSSCDYFREKGIADIYKRPTPIKVVKMSKEHPGMISEAYFQEKSTTDYVGIYHGKYIDFECKETIHDEIPYAMIREQQFRHLDTIIKMGGIGFFLVSFKKYAEAYLCPATYLLEAIKNGQHPSFKRTFFIEHGVLLKRGYQPAYDLISAIQQVYKI
ncbi:MAG: Holliday junction resolvase RecU [Bacilli bacterium]|jgi:recombination protein U|nr:Holliday junction resolvase RecU [Bacilli bacterium]